MRKIKSLYALAWIFQVYQGVSEISQAKLDFRTYTMRQSDGKVKKYMECLVLLELKSEKWLSLVNPGPSSALPNTLALEKMKVLAGLPRVLLVFKHEFKILQSFSLIVNSSSQFD